MKVSFAQPDNRSGKLAVRGRVSDTGAFEVAAFVFAFNLQRRERVSDFIEIIRDNGFAARDDERNSDRSYES